MNRLLALFACIALTPFAHAVDSGQRFTDPAEQARYERIIRDLRCLVGRWLVPHVDDRMIPDAREHRPQLGGQRHDTRFHLSGHD